MTLIDPMLRILRSPGGEELTYNNGQFVTPLGRTYPYEKGVAFIYDREDVSPFLLRDASRFQAVQDVVEHPAPKTEPTERDRIYMQARSLNTEFMFSVLTYENAEKRRVVEVGVGACDIIRRFIPLGFEVIAVDFFPWEMQESLQSLARAGEPPFACVAAPMACLPFADHSVDLIYFHAALHHALPRRHEDFEWSNARNLVDCLAEVKRVLKPREEGGAFFLLGEGIYPEEYKLEERHYEVGRQANPDDVYEAWYKISEYEKAYELAGIYPNLFLWQDYFIVKAFGYTPDGVKIEVASGVHQISDKNYWLLSERIDHCERFILPDWIHIRKMTSTFDRLFEKKDDVDTNVHSAAGRFSQVNGYPSFSIDPGKGGFLLYGPYTRLSPGQYEVQFCFLVDGAGPAVLTFDVISKGGVLKAPEPIDLGLNPPNQWITVKVTFEVAHDAEMVETRVLVSEPGQARIAVAAAVAIAKLS